MKRIFSGQPSGRRIHIPAALSIGLAVSLLPTLVSAQSVGGSGKLDLAAAMPSQLPSVTLTPAARRPDTDDAAPQIAQRKRVNFDLSQVERIRVRVWGSNDLSGEYALNPDLSLSFPRIGRLDVEGLTPAALEQTLSQRLSALTRTDVTVAVEVAKFRPYFIMGQVVEPGAIEWQPGLKVIQAISLARGVVRASDTAQTVGNDRRSSRTQLTFAVAELARLKAERDGRDVIPVVEPVAQRIKAAGDDGQSSLINLIARQVARQNDMLSEQRELMEAQISGLQRDRDAAQREVEAAERQQRAVLEQLEITRAQLADVEDLRNKQLVSKSRYLSQKSELLTGEVRYAEAHSILQRARARLNAIDQQLVMVPQQRRVTLGERIESLEREVARLEHASGMGSSSADEQNNVLKLRYHIARESSTGVRTIPATVFTEILPGDVLVVSDGADQSGVVATSSDLDAAQRVIEDAAAGQGSIFRRASSSDISPRGRY